MSATLLTLLLRLSEADAPFLVPGPLAAPHYGLAFDRLLVAGVLEQLAPLSAWPACDGCECGMGQRAIQRRGGALLAECPLDPSSDAALSAADVEVYAIHVRRLVLQATDGRATELATPGLWRLPDLPDRTEVFLTLTRRIVDDPAAPAALRGYARGSRIVFVAPRASEAARRAFASAPDIRLVEASDALALEEGGGLVLNQRALPTRCARLLVDLVAGRVDVEGVEQSVNGQAFGLLKLLVEAFPGQRWASSREISDEFNGRAASDLVRELRDDLAGGRENAAEIRGWIQNRSSPSGYRLGLPPDAVTILGDPR